jgi:hypothetical protein
LGSVKLKKKKNRIHRAFATTQAGAVLETKVPVGRETAPLHHYAAIIHISAKMSQYREQ